MDELRVAWERAERELTAINDGDWGPFTVHPDGRVAKVPYGTPYAPGEDGTLYLDEDEDGQVDDPDLHQEGWTQEGWAPAKPTHWELWTGYTGQYGYNGPIMHPSEILRGGIVRDMVARAQSDGRPATYCCLVVESLPHEGMNDESDLEPNPVGWALAELVEA